VDMEEFGGAWNVISEGMINGFAGFIVCRLSFNGLLT